MKEQYYSTVQIGASRNYTIWCCYGSYTSTTSDCFGFESGISYSGKALSTGRVTEYSVKCPDRDATPPPDEKKVRKRK